MEKPKLPEEPKVTENQQLREQVNQLTARLTLISVKESMLDEATFRFEVLKMLERIAVSMEKMEK